MLDEQVNRLLPLEDKPSLIVAQFGTHGMNRATERYYQEPGLWSLHLYLYEAQLRIGDERHQIRPGSFALAPPECTLEYHLNGRSEHLYALFNVTQDGQTTPVPAIQPLGDAEGDVRAEFEDMIALAGGSPLRAEVKLWDLLLRAAERARVGTQTVGTHPAVSRAVRLIEKRLGEPIALDQLADLCGVSHSHLARLFRTELGIPPVRYIVRRRMEIAMHLLRHSTMPVHAIADQVGMPDLQMFNKIVNRYAGMSPRAVRKSR